MTFRWTSKCAHHSYVAGHAGAALERRYCSEACRVQRAPLAQRTDKLLPLLPLLAAEVRKSQQTIMNVHSFVTMNHERHTETGSSCAEDCIDVLTGSTDSLFQD